MLLAYGGGCYLFPEPVLPFFKHFLTCCSPGRGSVDWMSSKDKPFSDSSYETARMCSWIQIVSDLHSKKICSGPGLQEGESESTETRSRLWRDDRAETRRNRWIWHMYWGEEAHGTCWASGYGEERKEESSMPSKFLTWATRLRMVPWMEERKTQGGASWRKGDEHSVLHTLSLRCVQSQEAKSRKQLNGEVWSSECKFENHQQIGSIESQKPRSIPREMVWREAYDRQN